MDLKLTINISLAKCMCYLRKMNQNFAILSLKYSFRHATIVLHLETIIAIKLFKKQIKILRNRKMINKNELVKIFVIKVNNYK